MEQPVPTPVVPRRRVWPWVLGFCAAPFVLLGLAAASYLTLDRDAAALRRHVIAATRADWNTKIQVSVGRVTLGVVRSGLGLSDKPEAADARLALAAVRNASVGVYGLASGKVEVSREKLFADTDAGMKKRGWSRLVGVAEDEEAVLVYASDGFGAGDRIELCVAVVNGRELVVASTTVEADALNGLLERHAGEKLRATLRQHARL